MSTNTLGVPRLTRHAEDCRYERIKALQSSLRFYENKGARDTAIELGLGNNCMALNVRIFGVLKKVRLRVSPDDIEPSDNPSPRHITSCCTG